MTRPHPRRSPGYTLIEALVLITSIASFLVLAGILIQAMLRLDRSERVSRSQADGSARLARAFREDAHAAVGPARLDNDGATIVFPAANDRTVAFTAAPGEVVRVESAGGKTAERERYTFPRDVRSRFATVGNTASLIFEAGKSERGSLAFYRGLRFDAETGRDSRIRGGTP